MATFGIFVPDEPEVHREALLAVARGFDRRMIDYELCRLDQGYQPCEVVVTFGIAKAATRRGRWVADVLARHREQLTRHESETGEFNSRDTMAWDHLVIERGFVHRDRYFMLGWGGLNGRAHYCNHRSPKYRFDQLGVRVASWRTTGNHIVLCGQVPWDASVQHTDHVSWCRETSCRLSQLTDRRIRFRPHPMQPTAIDMEGCPVTISQNPALADDLTGAWAVVTFNSNAGVEATLEGIPAFAADPGAMGYSILNHDLSAIESPAMPDRTGWLHDLAYTQWTLDEIAAGMAIEHLWNKRRSPLRNWWNHIAGRYRKTSWARSEAAWRGLESTPVPSTARAQQAA